MRVGRGSSCGEETESESTCPVIREARDGMGSLGESVATAGKVAAIGQGRRALGVGPVGGIRYGKMVVLFCSSMELKVFPEGDHMKAIFAPKGSRAPGGKFKAAGTLGITGIGEF